MAGRPDRARPPAGPVSRLRGLPRAPRPKPSGSTGLPDATPLPWQGCCFDEIVYAETSDARIAFYVSALDDTQEKPVLLLLHGAGCTGLTYAPLARRLRSENVPLLAPDLRGHGLTKSERPRPLEMATLAHDVCEGVHALFKMRGAAVPPLVVVGHSMGGALAAHVARYSALPVIGTVLIDVVEGTALSALPAMAGWLAARPRSFVSQEAAVRYALTRGLVRCAESARLSLPSQLVSDGARWRWRTDLAETQPCWEGWFRGLTANFLGSEGPKMLVLASVDRLDRDLTIAHMQGKFQQIFIPEAGHAIHEDQPDKMAAVLLDFLRRNLLGMAGPAPGVLPVFQQRAPVAARDDRAPDGAMNGSRD